MIQLVSYKRGSVIKMKSVIFRIEKGLNKLTFEEMVKLNCFLMDLGISAKFLTKEGKEYII